MATSRNFPVRVGAYDTIREYLKENTALFGLVRWSTIVHRETIDTEVIVTVPQGTKVTINEIDQTKESKEWGK